MTCQLLDANVLIALSVRNHVHHARARRWAADLGAFAVCPITEGALVRFLLRLGERPETITALLAALGKRRAYEFWSDDLSYASLDLTGVHGHRQATDAYLVGLAEHHGGAVATLDRAMATEWPAHVLLLPE